MPRRNLTDIQWILDALEQDDTKTRNGIGDAINIDKTGVSRLLSGFRALKLRESLKIAEYLGVAPPFGFAEKETEFTPASMSTMAPVYRAAPDGDWPPATFRIFRQDRPVDYRSKAAHFAAASEVFAFYVQDGLMAPRFKPGELLFADPTRPIATGDDVLFTGRRQSSGGERALIGELTSSTPALFQCFQHGKRGDLRLSAKVWATAVILRGY